ncbi:MAG TPA: response regulator [Thermoanaerobaculia bacterium]|nr:response regulator [Thermoanaerobaculia bacterium]
MTVSTLSGSDLSGRRLLIVEEDRELAGIYRQRLVPSGLEIDLDDGSTALEKLRNKEFDLLILDLAPSAGGGDLLAMMLAEGIEIATVVITGKADVRDAIEALSHPVASFHLKSDETILELPSILSSALALFRLRKEADGARRMYRELFDQTLEPIVIVEPVTTAIVDCNPAFERLIGRKHEELIRMRSLDLRDKQERDRIEQIIRDHASLPEGEHVEYETTMLRSDGQRLYLQMRTTLSNLAGGDVFVSYVRDLTAEKSAEIRYKQMFLRAFEAILIFDDEGRVVDANPAFEAMTGWQLSELQRLPSWMTLLRDETDEPVPEERWPALIDSETTLRIATREGPVIQVLIKAARLTSEGQPVSMVTMHDLRAEIRTAELERSLLQAQKIQSLGLMASGIAHDFNNTLMAALPWADLLRRKYPDDEMIQKATDNVRRAVHRAKDVTRQLLDFAQPKRPQSRRIRLAGILQQHLKMIRPAIPPEIAIELFGDDSPVEVEADPAQIGQVFLNLALNAREAMPHGGTLTLEIREPTPSEEQRWALTGGAYVFVVVRDTGVGIPKEILGKIFDPFFTTKDIGKGSGLGLAVAHRIVQEHMGRIVAISDPGAGTTFYIALPKVFGMEQEQAGDRTGSFSLRSARILIIDDDLEVSEGLEALFKREGADVTAVTRGSTALRLIDSGYIPDVVILDLGLPEMPGEEVHARIRERLGTTRILISSGYGSREQADALLTDPFTRFCQKPYSFEDLLEELAAIR